MSDYQLLDNRNWLQQKYIEEYLSAEEISNIVKCHPSSVFNALKKFQITLHFPQKGNKKKGGHPQSKETKEKISNANKNKKSSVSHRRNLGKAREGRRFKRRKANLKILDNYKWIDNEYTTKRRNILDIAREVNCDWTTVRKALNDQNIPVRMGSIVQRETIKSTKLKHKFKGHHTEPELIFEGICKKYNLPFHYVGDGQLWIGEEKVLNPDFTEVNGKKICVEVFGDYWHSPLLNPELRENALLGFRKNHFRKYGWTSIFIWERDLKRKDAEKFVLIELKKFGIE